MQLLKSLKKKAKAMGNTVGSNRKGNKQVVTVLQADGRVLEFRRPTRVSELLRDHPNHFICHSSALVLMQQGRMLPQDAVLNRGEVYFLLPLPKQQSVALGLGSGNTPPLTPQQPVGDAKPAGTMKFVISKQQLAKILADGSMKLATDCRPAPPTQVIDAHTTSSVRVLHRPAPTLSMKRTATWTPGLDSISEVPVM